MCDTLILRHQGQTWFAKNSDREPAEPQRLLRLPAVRNDPEARLRTTYLDIPQTAQRHALVISQPSWIWGAEMGVNEHGVAIGNEAVFTKLTRQRGTALLGMDLLRLGLERGASAREALEVITGLLQRYGQGGPAGYRDKRIRYDNSFLIADPGEAWVLETAGNLWAAKKVERWAISNALTLGHEFDLCSRDLEDQARRQGCWDGRGDFHFARVFDTRLLPWVGGAHRRCRVNQRFLDSLPGEPDWHALFAALRHHGPRGDHFRRHNNRQVWHARRQLLAAFADHRQSGRPLARRRPVAGRHRYFGAVPGTVPAAVLRSGLRRRRAQPAARGGTGVPLVALRGGAPPRAHRPRLPPAPAQRPRLAGTGTLRRPRTARLAAPGRGCRSLARLLA